MAGDSTGHTGPLTGGPPGPEARRPPEPGKSADDGAEPRYGPPLPARGVTTQLPLTEEEN